MDMSDSRLMRLFAELTAWAGYAQTQAALADIEEERLEAKSKKIAVLKSLSAWDEGSMKATEVRARRDADPEVLAVEEELVQARALRKLLNVLFSKYERDANLLSRELTRRTGSAPKENRVRPWQQ